MSHDDLVRALAAKAGFSVDWTDQTGERRSVAPETLRRLLAAMDLACESERQASEALKRLDEADGAAAPLIAVPTGLPFPVAGRPGAAAKLTREDGVAFDVILGDAGDGRGQMRPILEPGYHRLDFGGETVTVAVAPERGLTIVDAGRGRRMWGLAAQVYGLTHEGDGGIGDLGGVAVLAEAVARRGGDALALSPLHAGFSADPDHYGPYSPSSRLFLNPLSADPDFLFGEERVRAASQAAGVDRFRALAERSPLIEWPPVSRAKLVTFRTLFESFRAVELAGDRSGRLAADFAAFRREGGALLQEHARFEAIHASRFGADPGQWDWRSWAEGLRDPRSAEVAAFAAEHEDEVDFHLFLQWIADRSFAEAQGVAKKAGMAIGLISDLAVGMAAGGSHAWSRQDDVLTGLSVGAPPDLFNAEGQAWGLATFSPIALKRGGYGSFVATLRACMRNAGGVRIDHAMGLTRLWLVPEGARATEGAYLAFPADDMFRLIALESQRNACVVVGEDLGTVPDGFRERLGAAGVAGMRVLQFERDADGFLPPDDYAPDALAMTTTHDLPTMAGWWSGADVEMRARIAGEQFGETADDDRAKQRGELWAAFLRAGAAEGEPPAPAETGPAVDAAVRFLAATPSKLALLPLEDALGEIEQPNLPGTGAAEHPNWRRRLSRPAEELLAEPAAAGRLESLDRRRQA